MHESSIRSKSRERASKWVFRLVLLFALALSPWPFGSVTPIPAALLVITMLVLSGLFLVVRVYFGSLHPLPASTWLVAALGLVVLQQIPLPPTWSEIAAPSVSNLYAFAPIKEGMNGWHPLSAEPFQTRWWFIQLASFFACFWLSSQLFRHGPERRLVTYTLAALGVALSLFGVYQSARFGTELYGRYAVPSGTPYGPFVNHNHFAGFVEVCALVTLGSALGLIRRNASLALLLGGASAIMGISILLSHSRGGLLAAGTGVAVLTLLARTNGTLDRKWIAAGAVAIGVFVLSFAPTGILERYATLGDPTGDTSVRFRLDLWKDSLGMAVESPLIGTGLGTYAAVIPAYRTSLDETRAEFAESDWLQLLCETGVVGLAIAIGFLASIARLAVRAIQEETSQRSRGALLGLAAAASALIVHGLFDFNLHIPSNAMLFAMLLGLLAASSPTREREYRGNFLVAAVPAVALTIGVAVVTMDIGRSRDLTRQIDPLLTEADEFTERIQELVGSRERVPLNPETAFLLGRLYNEEAYRAEDAARYREVRLDQAVEAFEGAIRLAPARGRYWFERAWTEANRGNDALADQSFERALELEPSLAGLRANYALYLASLNRLNDALAQLERGRALQPGIQPLEALNIIAPYVQGDTALMRRAAGSDERGEAAIDHFLREAER